jgi:hypothetical protein
MRHSVDTKESVTPTIQDKPSADTSVTMLPQILNEAQAANPTSNPIQCERPKLRSIFIPRVIIPVCHYGLLGFVDQCMWVLIPLMYSTSPQFGGLGFSSNSIGLVMMVWSMFNGTIQVYAFPRLLRRLGPKRLYIISFAFFLIAFAAFPLMGHLAKNQMEAGMWCILCVQLASYLVAYSTYSKLSSSVHTHSPVTVPRLYSYVCQQRGTEKRPAWCDEWLGADGVLDDAWGRAIRGIFVVLSVIGEEPRRRDSCILDNVCARHIGALFRDISTTKPYLTLSRHVGEEYVVGFR